MSNVVISVCLSSDPISSVKSNQMYRVFLVVTAHADESMSHGSWVCFAFLVVLGCQQKSSRFVLFMFYCTVRSIRPLFRGNDFSVFGFRTLEDLSLVSLL